MKLAGTVLNSASVGKQTWMVLVSKEQVEIQVKM
jgi:hypothetical protein